MATRKQIRQAFETIILAYATAKPIPISFENAKFSPPDASSYYLKTLLLPAADFNTSLCYGTENNLGVFQIDIVCPVDAGTAQAEVLAEEITALYPQGSRIGTGGTAVRVARPIAVERGVNEKDRWVLSLSVYYSLI